MSMIIVILSHRFLLEGNRRTKDGTAYSRQILICASMDTIVLHCLSSFVVSVLKPETQHRNAALTVFVLQTAQWLDIGNDFQR
jgi:hypothetical protein